MGQFNEKTETKNLVSSSLLIKLPAFLLVREEALSPDADPAL